jgi:hypothetical protein
VKITWVSPAGAGLDLALACRTAGHQIVVYGATSALPAVPKEGLAQACRVADLVVVDGPHPAERTPSSWRPSQDSLFFDELRRHHRVTALGPTPTIDLLVADARYLRKMCRRFGVPYGAAEGEPWSSGGWYRSKEIVPPGAFLEPWAPLFRSIGFRGWFQVDGVLTEDGPVVTGASADWPAETIPVDRTAEFLQHLAA